MERSSPRRALLVPVAGAVLLAAALVLVFFSARSGAPPADRAPDGAPASSNAGAGARSEVAGERPAVEPLPPEARAAPSAEPDPLADPEFESALRWSAVDLEAVQRALPDNLYWQLSSPTRDAEELRRRDAERARWNHEYGKVLSGTATDAELRDYFSLRRRVSEDAIAFASHLLDHYGDALPERDVGLLELSLRLHAARLEELPRREAEAQQRKREQDRLREAWLADEAAFAADGAGAEDDSAR